MVYYRLCQYCKKHGGDAILLFWVFLIAGYFAIALFN
jgi:hypothetical protein